MNKHLKLLLLISLMVCASPAFGQADEVLAEGIPPLTRQMAERIVNYYAYLLNVNFTDAQRNSFQSGLVGYWKNQNFEKMGTLTVTDEEAIQLFALPETEKQRLRIVRQGKVLQALREEKADALSQFLVSLYDETRKNYVIPCAPAETSSNSAAARLLKIGRYEGTALNETAGLTGKTIFDVKNIDSTTGKISVSIYFYAGLAGEGTLTGTIGESGKITLSGKLSEWQICVQGVANANGLAADYRIEDSSVQTGNFKVAFKGQATNNPVSTKFPANLIGKWKFDDYQPGARSSNISPNLTAGYSKLWTVEFFEDGSYKYIETNRLCPTGSTCCRNNNQLEKGTFSITEAGFDFAFKSGDMMHTDECNPKQAATTPMRKTDAHLQGMYKWAIGPTGEMQVMTFCIQKEGKTVCFVRTK